MDLSPTPSPKGKGRNTTFGNQSEFNSQSGIFFQAFSAGSKSFVGRRVSLFKDADKETCPLRQGFAGLFEDFCMTLDVFGG